MTVGVVTGFIPLPVLHLAEAKYHELGRQLFEGCKGFPWYRGEGPLEECWAYDLCTGLPPANPPPADRYPTPEINVMSHIVQHQRTTWAMRAAREFTEIDTWVWFDYGIMKQGYWNGRPMTVEAVKTFLQRLRDMGRPDTIPFPGIDEVGPVYPTGNNWRFVGSTHIWPRKYLSEIDAAYKHQLRDWVARHKTVPLDLPIWALVEQRHLELPFRFYQGEYDVTQLTGLPDAV
jgi:hypothetical protein